MAQGGGQGREKSPVPADRSLWNFVLAGRITGAGVQLMLLHEHRPKEKKQPLAGHGTVAAARRITP